jgi:hypothetical protein
MHDFMRSLRLEPGTYAEAVGLRADEQWRYFKMLDRNERDNRNCIAPLVKAQIAKPDVMRFWAGQPFDLGLMSVEGNCDLCFLKGRKHISALIRRDPTSAEWWDRMERTIGKGTFSSRYSIATLVKDVERQPMLSGLDEYEEYDAECGLWCAGEGQ